MFWFLFFSWLAKGGGDGDDNDDEDDHEEGGTAPVLGVGLCWVVRAFAGFQRLLLVSCFPFAGSSGPPFGV